MAADKDVHGSNGVHASDTMLESDAVVERPTETATGPGLAAASTLDLTVVIVNYNVRDFLKQAIRSVQRACSKIQAEIIVVDNNSADGSVEMINSSFPDVKLISNEENIGFSRANNQGLRISSGEFIVILNPDTIVSEDTFEVLIEFLRSRPEAGAAGCQILHPDGSFARESRRAFPTPLVAFFRVSGLSTIFPRSKLFGRYNMSYLPTDEVAEVDALSGSCMMVRRKALLEDGPGVKNPEPTANGRDRDVPRLLDEEFFMYGEDLDWCYRIQKAGWKILYTPDTKIIHYKGESTRKGELRYVRLFYGAMVRFSRKHFHGYGRFVVELLRIAIIFKAFLSIVGSAIRASLPILIDFVITYAAVVVASILRVNDGLVLPNTLFMLSVAPAFAIATVLGIGISGGYRIRSRNIRSVIFGLLLAILVVSAASFFVKQIAFSRLIVVFSAAISAILLGLIRLRTRYRAANILKVLLLGTSEDGDRLVNAVKANPNPSFEIIGMIDTEDDTSDKPGRLPTIGRLDQLRDVARLRGVDTIAIAAGRLPNHQVFSIIRELRDLKVTFRMLTDSHDRTIGKASINDLSAPRMVDVDKILGRPRSTFEKRIFGISVAVIALLLYPIRLVLSGFRFRDVNRRSRELLEVIANSRSIVGFREDDQLLAPASLQKGVFSIVDALPGPADEESRSSAYGFYLANESTQLDWDIIMRSLRNNQKKAHLRKKGQ